MKFSGVLPLPWDFQASAVFQNLPGVPVNTSYVATNAQIAPSLGRNLAACGASVTCNAAVTIPALYAPDTKFEHRLTQVDFRLTKIVAGAMALRGSGVVVHVSSDAAVAAYPRWGAYSVTKAALDHLNRLWAAELLPTGVRFLSVDPGEMDTEMHAAAMPEADRGALDRPEQVARRIARLVADAGRIESGTRLVVAGP